MKSYELYIRLRKDDVVPEGFMLPGSMQSGRASGCDNEADMREYSHRTSYEDGLKYLYSFLQEPDRSFNFMGRLSESGIEEIAINNEIGALKNPLLEAGLRRIRKHRVELTVALKAMILELYNDGRGLSVKEIAQHADVHPNTVYRVTKWNRPEQ